MLRDPLDPRSLGKRRAIPWEAIDVSRLDGKGRAVVGASWRERRAQEHLAVSAFAIVARELAEVGCDPVVLALVTRAASDEVRHAEVCRRLAVALLGERAVPARVRGAPKIPLHEAATPEARALFHVVEMACLSETLTGVFFTEMVARTTDAGAKVAIEALLEDEIDHGRLGWAYLAERARAGSVGGLAEALPSMLVRTIDPVVRAAAKATREDDAALEALGYLGPRASAAVYLRALRGVILPGFEELGIELGPSMEHARASGWLA